MNPALNSLKNSVKTVVNNLYTKHLLVTNVATCGTLLALGDFIVQNIEKKYVKDTQGRVVNYSFQRTGRMFVIGLALGPFNHFWYRFLDQAVTGTGLQVVAKKIAVDQAVAGPFFCTAFLLGSGLLEGKPIGGCFREWKEKFLTIYLADWCIWPPTQFMNFYFLPSRFRVAYVASVTLCWNTFLSFMKHKEGLYQGGPHDAVVSELADIELKPEEEEVAPESGGGDE